MTRWAVSYVVPVYNGERYLDACLESIVKQTVAPHEVIVVDDGSCDGTAAVAERFGDPVRYVYQAHAGHSAARNRGARAATGELLGFVDADDLLLPAKAAAQLACFVAQPELDFCDAYARNFWSPDVPAAERCAHPRARFTHSEQPRGHGILTWLMRRDLFDRIGDFDPTLLIGEDEDWYHRMQASGARTVTLDQIVARRRLHANNLTLRHYDEYLRIIVRNSYRRIRTLRDTGGSGATGG